MLRLFTLAYYTKHVTQEVITLVYQQLYIYIYCRPERLGYLKKTLSSRIATLSSDHK